MMPDRRNWGVGVLKGFTLELIVVRIDEVLGEG